MAVMWSQPVSPTLSSPRAPCSCKTAHLSVCVPIFPLREAPSQTSLSSPKLRTLLKGFFDTTGHSRPPTTE